jgi:ribosomal protein L12E/L44/L45/RPP1/RPP2
MNAYEGIITKKEFVKELKTHQKADNFIRGTFFNEDTGKGCAVGCSLKSISRLKNIKMSLSDHSRYPALLGIPEWIARLEDSIFEGMSEDMAKSWPVDFASAIKTGADLDKARIPFLLVVLKSSLKSLDSLEYDEEKLTEVKKSVDQSRAAVKQMVKALKSGNSEEIVKARDAAASATAAANSAANYAANAAYYAADAAAHAANAERKTYNSFAVSLLKIIKSVK